MYARGSRYGNESRYSGTFIRFRKVYIFTVHRLYTTSLLFLTFISDFECSVTGQEKQDYAGNDKTRVEEPLKDPEYAS